MSISIETQSGGLTQSAADVRYEPQEPYLVAPGDPRIVDGVSAQAANRLTVCRVIVPVTGTLVDFRVFCGGVGNNVIGAVFDTGDSAAGSRTRLWSSGSVAAVTGWLDLGDPNLAVTAGQQLDLGLITDGNTATFGRMAIPSGLADLPAGFWPVDGGASPKVAWRRDVGSFSVPTSVTEANCDASLASYTFLMARVEP